MFRHFVGRQWGSGLVRSQINGLLRREPGIGIISACRNYSVYEGDGKTTVTIMNQEENAPLMINSYSIRGFRLNNGMQVIGPAAFFPKSVLSWNVKDPDNITLECLTPFLVLQPPIGILILGCNHPNKIDGKICQHIRSVGINLELMHSERACAAFNYLNFERRSVAAAIFPPENVDFNVSEQALRQEKYPNLYQDDKS